MRIKSWREAVLHKDAEDMKCTDFVVPITLTGGSRYVLTVGIRKMILCILLFCFWHFVFQFEVYGRSPRRRRFRPSPACILCRKLGHACQGSRKRPAGLDLDKVAASGKVRAVMGGKTGSKMMKDCVTSHMNFVCIAGMGI